MDLAFVFIAACGLAAVVLLVLGLCAAAGQADERLEDMFRERAIDELRERRSANR